MGLISIVPWKHKRDQFSPRFTSTIYSNTKNDFLPGLFLSLPLIYTYYKPHHFSCIATAAHLIFSQLNTNLDNMHAFTKCGICRDLYTFCRSLVFEGGKICICYARLFKAILYKNDSYFVSIFLEYFSNRFIRIITFWSYSS